MPSTSPSAGEARWQQAHDGHRVAVAAFLAAATGVADGRWNEARGEGKWSPAQIAEHLRLTYVTLRAELEGGGGFRVRVGRWRLLVLRLVVLRRILGRRVFPQGAPATREVRPAAGPFDRATTLAALQSEASAFERALVERRGQPSTHLTHPFFGRLTPVQGMELSALHVDHHRAQLPALTGASATAGATPAVHSATAT